MSETKPSIPRPLQPPEKPTVGIEKPPPWAIALAEKMEAGFLGLRADVSMVSHDVGLLRDRVVILERHKLEAEERAAKYSGGVRQLSETDAKHEAAIASVIVKQDELAADVAATKALVVAGNADTADLKRELISGVKSFWRKHPKLETALVGLILAVFGLASAWIAGRMHP